MQLLTSWDDGTQQDKMIALLLKEYKMPGTFYITLGNVGKTGYLGWNEIREIAKDFAIGSHTMNHPQDMKLLSSDEKFFEIVTSRDLLTTAVGGNENGHPYRVKSFCYPRGRYDQECVELVKRAGYEDARTTKVLKIRPGKKFERDTTVHFYQRKEYDGVSPLEIGKKYFDMALEKDAYFHLWGHSWEIDNDGNFDELEKLLKYMAEKLKRK